MRKIILFFSFLLLIPFSVKADSGFTNVYFFYGDGCPHCAKEELFLDKLEITDDHLKVYRYEVWHNRDNSQKLSEVAKAMNLQVRGVPITIIGDRTISGYLNDQTTGKQIEQAIADFRNGLCVDAAAPVLEITDSNCEHGCDTDDQDCRHNCGCQADINNKVDSDMPDKIGIPLFGNVDVKNISLPALTVLVAAADGFNPCAMWILLFLINLLLGMQDKRRMWVLGSAFILSSGVVYFLFLSAWLNLLLFLGLVLWVRLAIGGVSLFSGAFHLKEYWENRDGTCKVAGKEKRKNIFDKLKKIATHNQFWLALLGIVILAAAVNLVELFCSAGLPAVFTQVLTMSNLPVWQYYLYLILYIIVFMADDMLIFFVAMKTLQLKAIDSKYARYSNLIGGIIMLLIGVLLLFKPGWLMFG